MKKFATLTIGQAPRPDLAPVFNAIAPAGTEVVHAGCLDGLTKAEVDKQFAPVGSEGLLTSRMLDGTAVVLGKSAVRKALQEKIHQLEKAGCSPIVLLCTGEFEGLTTEKVRLIEPDRLLPPVFAALLNPLQVGVMVPLIEQAQSVREETEKNVTLRGNEITVTETENRKYSRRMRSLQAAW